MEIQNLMQEIRKDALDKMEKRSPEDFLQPAGLVKICYTPEREKLFSLCCRHRVVHGQFQGLEDVQCAVMLLIPPLKKWILMNWLVYSKESLEKYEITEKTVVKIFVSGSFLNPEEIPKSTRDEILNLLKGEEFVEEVVVEVQTRIYN